MFSDLNQFQEWVRNDGPPVAFRHTSGAEAWLNEHIAVAEAKVHSLQAEVSREEADEERAKVAHALAVSRRIERMRQTRDSGPGRAFVLEIERAEEQLAPLRDAVTAKLDEIREHEKGSPMRRLLNDQLDEIEAQVKSLKRTARQKREQLDRFCFEAPVEPFQPSQRLVDLRRRLYDAERTVNGLQAYLRGEDAALSTAAVAAAAAELRSALGGLRDQLTPVADALTAFDTAVAESGSRMNAAHGVEMLRTEVLGGLIETLERVADPVGRNRWDY